MFWLRNEKNYFQVRTLIRGPVKYMIFISGKQGSKRQILRKTMLRNMEHAIFIFLEHDWEQS